MAVTGSVARVVVTGASGNVGTGVLRALAADLPGAEVVGVCRRPPGDLPGTGPVRWHAVDLADEDAAGRLAPVLAGADAVVHLAWAIQPVDDTAYLHRANVDGTRRVLAAVAAAGVGHLVFASSLGVYAPGAAEPVTEDWPASGQATSVYSRHKVAVERMLDLFGRDHPDVVVTRLRPTLVTQRDAAAVTQRLFLGPLVPRPAFGLLERRKLPVLPIPAGLALQFVHADDVGDAVVRILRERAPGAFNLAADALGTDALADLVGARAVPVPPATMRAAVGALHAVRAVPVSPGWYDVALNTPLMDTSRAREVLGWAPRRTTTECARELLAGLADGAAGPSPAMGGPTVAELVAG